MDNPHPMLTHHAAESIQNSLVLEEFKTHSMEKAANLVISTYCPDRSRSSLRYCTELWFFLFGRNMAQIEIDPMILLEIPTYISPSVSIRQWNHLLQLNLAGKFQSYDGRGDSGFRQSNRPPFEYNLQNVKIPVYLYQGAEDLIVSRLVCTHLRCNRKMI